MVCSKLIFALTMNLYSKDFLLDGKIVYYQLKKGYRSGIELLFWLLMQKKHNKILDMGSGCGSISLIVAYRNPESEVIGFEKMKLIIKFQF